MYEQSLVVNDDHKKAIDHFKIFVGNFQIIIDNNHIIEAKYQQANELQSQKINLLQLQIIELQKFIFSGKQEKFKLNPNSNQQQAGSQNTNPHLILASNSFSFFDHSCACMTIWYAPVLL